jgi:dTDP-4-amino-4,6-dideoxygalactose transaminase
MPGPGWYSIDESEGEEVLAAVRERAFTRYRFDDPAGVSRTMLFERTMAKLLGAKRVLAMNSCTSALLAGLVALGVRRGDEVIVPGYTFIATIAVVLFLGARPVVAEIDDSLTLDPADVSTKLTDRTKGIIPVHMIGAPADLGSLAGIAREAGCFMLEDVAQACGARYRGARLGTIGDAGAFSFNVSKTMTTGDGGLLVTSSDAVYERAFSFHDHGYAPDRAGVIDEGAGLGLNLRMHELAAALGLAQAPKLDTILDRCRALKQVVRAELEGMRGVRERLIHDGEECASAHVLLFDDHGRARTVATALGGDTLSASPKHNYAKMVRLHPEIGAVDSMGAPQRAARSLLPQTDDILGRSVALSIGLVDGYLGTVGDVNVLDTPEQAARKAARIRRLIERS